MRRWRWPGKGNDKNLANTCGFRKPFSYYHQSLYSAQPLVRIAVAPPDFEANLRKYAGRMWNGLYSHWNWQGQGPDTLQVFTFSNAECVELLLNGRSLGQKSPRDFAERIITWDVPNEPGTLAAVATNAGRVVAVHELVTAGNAVRLELIPDRSPLLATGQDLAHVEVRAVDRHGVINPHCQSTAVCTISGPGTIAGVDNGDLYSPEPFRARQRELRDGRCLVIVQSTR